MTGPGAADVGAELDGTMPAASPLERLRTEITRRLTRDPIFVHVPERPGWRLRCDVNIRSEERIRWAEACTDKETFRLDNLRFAAVTIANQTEAIIDPDGNEVTDGGTALNFKSPALMEMLGVSRVADGVLAFFGVDPHVDAAASRLFDAAGYADDVDVDPTPSSSRS
jgi:hypothetical protein